MCIGAGGDLVLLLFVAYKQLYLINFHVPKVIKLFKLYKELKVMIKSAVDVWITVPDMQLYNGILGCPDLGCR